MLTLRKATADDLDTITAFQQRAYAVNRILLGVEPLPLLVRYADILKGHEIWLAEAGSEVQGILILEVRETDLLIWSVAVDPAVQRGGIGTELLAFADTRASESRRSSVRLYTGLQLEKNIAWYRRLGFAVERQEHLSDRTLVHMVKKLA